MTTGAQLLMVIHSVEYITIATGLETIDMLVLRAGQWVIVGAQLVIVMN